MKWVPLTELTIGYGAELESRNIKVERRTNNRTTGRQKIKHMSVQYRHGSLAAHKLTDSEATLEKSFLGCC